MKFRAMRCARSEAEQLYIFAMLENWNRLPKARREELLRLIDALSETDAERKALYEALRGRMTADAISRFTFVPIQRIYALKRKFYERVKIR